MRKNLGSEPPNYFNLDIFLEILEFFDANFPQTTLGIFMRSDKIIVRLTFRVSQRGASSGGDKVREHENGINCVQLRDMWDVGPAPKERVLNLTNPAQRQNYCATQFLMVDSDEQNDLMFRPNMC